MISNCNCPEKIDCGCELEFDSYETGTTSVLDVGSLVNVGAEICEIEGYVIDWYRNGELALVSASEVGLTDEATAIHPFTGNSAIPIEGGTYVPVVRFVIIDGEKIFTTPKLCQKWCDMTITLPEIEVERLNCGSSNITGDYQFRIIYYSNVPGSLPSRTIAIDLPADQSTKYIAFYFYGANVADQIDVLLNGITTLTSWVVGDNLTASQFNTQPYHRDYTACYFVVELPEYEEGDFLKIVISPSIIEEIPQTDWEFRYKCLDNSKDFDCSIFSLALREYDITDWSFVHNEVACQREFRIKMVYPFPVINSGDNLWFSRYMQIGTGMWNSSTSYLTDQYAGVTLPHTIGWYAIQFILTNYAVRAATAGNVNLKKVGNVFTFTFSDVDDYDAAYANYQAGIASSWYTTREVSDTSDYKYYRFWYWKWRSRPENCGDTTNYERRLMFHCGSSIVFSDSGGVYTCTITSLVVTNEYRSDTCNNVVTTINGYINGVNAAIGASDYEEDTLCFEWKMFGLGYGILSEVPQIYSTNSGAVSVVSYGNVGPCLPFDLMCDPSKMPMNIRWDGFIWYFRLVVTLVKDSNEVDWPRDEETGEYIDDPCENFKVYWCLDEDGCYLSNTNDHVLILEVVDGVVTYQLAYEDLYV